jgi:hypothetical protein
MRAAQRVERPLAAHRIDHGGDLGMQRDGLREATVGLRRGRPPAQARDDASRVVEQVDRGRSGGGR